MTYLIWGEGFWERLVWGSDPASMQWLRSANCASQADVLLARCRSLAHPRSKWRRRRIRAGMIACCFIIREFLGSRLERRSLDARTHLAWRLAGKPVRSSTGREIRLVFDCCRMCRKQPGGAQNHGVLPPQVNNATHVPARALWEVEIWLAEVVARILGLKGEPREFRLTSATRRRRDMPLSPLI